MNRAQYLKQVGSPALMKRINWTDAALRFHTRIITFASGFLQTSFLVRYFHAEGNGLFEGGIADSNVAQVRHKEEDKNKAHKEQKGENHPDDNFWVYASRRGLFPQQPWWGKV
mmetsp:Transcript_36780/g.68101  ORF Transcript_36780/g.68101 Transcript_36780/m.68101 type:complete len:113 (-) Transcript_36780:882-1220(-)